eukprot:7061408-Pyramimonas_sp.AAC.1
MHHTTLVHAWRAHSIIHPKRMHNIMCTHIRHTSRYGSTRIIHIHIRLAGRGRRGISSTAQGVR